MSDDLLDRARAWIAEDPDPATRAELEEVIARGDLADLADRFQGPLEFGTAGLRGRLGAGPHRMNRVVVIRAAAGLAAYLLDQGATPGSTVVIGYDARHDSDVFAVFTITVQQGAISQVFWIMNPEKISPLARNTSWHVGRPEWTVT